MTSFKKSKGLEETLTLEEELTKIESKLITKEEMASNLQKTATTESNCGTPSSQAKDDEEEKSEKSKEDENDEPEVVQEPVPSLQTPSINTQSSNNKQTLIMKQQFIIQNQQSTEAASNHQPHKSHYSNSLHREIEQSFRIMSTIKIPESVSGHEIYLGGIPSDLNKKLLVMDLDETLIHSDMRQGMISPDYSIPICCQGEMRLVQINIRPYAKECLNELSKYYEIVVFTASSFEYAHLIVNLLDPHRQYISKVLSREHCYMTESNFLVKDLRIFKDKALKDIVIVDNCILSFAFQLDNGVPIASYYQGKEDKELLLMMRYLVDIRLEEDVRVINRKSFKLVDMARAWYMSSLR